MEEKSKAVKFLRDWVRWLNLRPDEMNENKGVVKLLIEFLRHVKQVDL